MSASSIIGHVRRWLRDRRGAAAIEFAFIVPGMLVLSLGGIEFTMLLFDYHTASEAARRGARTLLINPPVASMTNLASTDITCTGTSASVNCSGASVNNAGTWTQIVAEVQAAASWVTPDKITVSYRASGLDDPTNPNIITPMMSVRLVGLQHDFAIVGLVPGLPATFNFPDFDTTQLGPSAVVN